MTDGRQIAEVSPNQITTKRGFAMYRTNPSVPQASGLPTRNRRIEVPGGKAAMIVDHSTGDIKGIGGMGYWWEEEVDTTRFLKLFLDGIKQAPGLSKIGIQVLELVYHQMRANPGSDEIKLTSMSPVITASATGRINAACGNSWKRIFCIAVHWTASSSSTFGSCSTATGWPL